MHLHNEILGLPIFDTATEGCKKLLSIKVKFQTAAGLKSKLLCILNVNKSLF